MKDIEIGGWVKLFRQFTEWEWYTDTPTKTLFLHFLLKAQHKDFKYCGKQLKAGQYVCGLYQLSDETGLSVKQIRTAIEKLISTGEIGKQSTSQYSIITVNNWIEYQIEGKQKANEGQTKGKQRATKQECKNVRSNLLHKLLKGNFEIKKEFIPLIEKWLNYKKDKKQEYKNEESLRAFIKKLLTLSGASFLKAEKIIEQSMANNWQGIFELKGNEEVKEVKEVWRI